MDNLIKKFLKDHIYLLDEGKVWDFLDLLWEEGLTSQDVSTIFSMLNIIKPNPITKDIIIKHFIETINSLISELDTTSPEDWEDYYLMQDNSYPIDEDGDLHLYKLMQGFRLHNYGLEDSEIGDMINKYRKDINFNHGEIFYY